MRSLRFVELLAGMSHLSSKTDVSALESIVVGGISGLGTRFVIAPIDFVKIRYQLNGIHVGGPQNVWHIITTAYKNEGIRSFWKGNLPASFLYVSYSACQFGTLRSMNKFLSTFSYTKEFSEPAKQFLSGGVSGIVGTFLTYPFDYLRTRGAASTRSGTMWKTIAETWQRERIFGFYHGISSALVSVFPYMGVFFGTYSYLRDESSHIFPGWFPQLLSSSFIAGAFSKTLVFPFDTVRKRIQVHGQRTLDDKSSFAHGVRYSHSFNKTAAYIVKTQGVKGLYRGLSLALFKAVPSSFLAVYLYERTIDCLDWLGSRTAVR